MFPTNTKVGAQNQETHDQTSLSDKIESKLVLVFVYNSWMWNNAFVWQ